MALRIIFLEEFGKAFVPKKFIPNLRNYMLKAGYDEVPYKFFGLLFYVSALITTGIFIGFVFPYIKGYPLLLIYLFSFFGWILVQFFFIVLFMAMIYFVLDLKIYHRTKKMEEQLPDFLQIVAANLRGGLTFERALWGAIKPRFQILASEMARTSKKVMTGYDISKALVELSDKYDSLMLKRTVDLLISEIESGGNIADLLDKIVDNLKETKELKEEMSASAVAYVIFISAIVIVISPLLFSLSFHLLTIILGFIGKLSVATARVSSLPFKISGSTSINPNDFRTFSLIAISIIALFSSMIVSIVEKGEIKGGLKYIPIYVLGSMGFYFVFMKLIGVLFSSIG
ncbi:MAG TPA: type II secretion system F family protein [Candidatus Nanoarchaeia archaeon]|nr:type II secretion system F family protein [Candidatus Nanoarchaeia archaeon]